MNENENENEPQDLEADVRISRAHIRALFARLEEEETQRARLQMHVEALTDVVVSLMRWANSQSVGQVVSQIEKARQPDETLLEKHYLEALRGLARRAQSPE